LLLPAALLRLLSREREWDLSGLQTFHPVPLLCSRTPVESTCPRHWRPRRCCPRSLDNEGFGDDCISGLTRSFGTCCHTLHAWRCRTRARLASGWRAAPLPGGSRTLWTATKGFSSLSRPSSFPVSPDATNAAAQTRIVSKAGIRLDSRKSVRSFKEIICVDISEIAVDTVIAVNGFCDW